MTVEWEPVEALTAWRFGLATGTAMSPPDRLLTRASPQLHAWYARAPLIPLQSRLNSARIATGLGVFSSQALVDFYSLIYDATDPNDLSGTDAWQLRLAFAGRTQDIRLDALRKLLDNDATPVQREASRALVAAAAARIVPNPDLQEVAPELIAAMLAGGLDREAADGAAPAAGWTMTSPTAAGRCWRWAPPTRRSWASAGSPASSTATTARSASAAPCWSARWPGLAGSSLARRRGSTAASTSGSTALRRGPAWSMPLRPAASRARCWRCPAPASRRAAIGQVPSSHLFHAVAALKRTGQDFTARMIAAEALSRT